MLERYLASDGEEYVDVNCLREALGIDDEHANPFREIEKLKKDLERTKSNLDYFAKLAQDRQDKIASLEKEKEVLQNLVRTYRITAHTQYGMCAAEPSKKPAFHCGVVSYSWSFDATQSIRVELNLTPTANYKGTFDLEDLKQYIQEYGNDKKLGILESVDYQNAKATRAELCDIWKGVTGRDKIQYDVTPLKMKKDIQAEFEKLKEFRKDIRKALCLKQYTDTEGVQEARRIHDLFIDLTYFKGSVARAVGLDSNAEKMDILEAVERLKGDKETEKLKEFRDNVCEIFDIPSSNTDDRILKELRNVCNRYDELEDFRADICGILDIDRLLGTPKQNDAVIKHRIERLKAVEEAKVKRCDELTAVIDDLKDILGGETLNNEELVEAVKELNADYRIIKQNFDRYCLAIGSLLNIPADRREDISWIEDCFRNSRKEYESWKYQADILARFKSNVCTAYESFRKAIWEALGKKSETLPEEDARIVNEIAMMKEGESTLLRFRDGIAKAIGIDYPTTNNFIAKRVADIYKDWGETNDALTQLRGEVKDLQDKYNDMRSKFEFQSGLRQQWHSRYESEHERANGVQKCLDKTREALRVKDISLETAKKQYEKVCGNLDTAQAAIDGLKEKVRELQKELKEKENPGEGWLKSEE